MTRATVIPRLFVVSDRRLETGGPAHGEATYVTDVFFILNYTLNYTFYAAV